MSREELSAIKKAIKTIQWSRDSTKAAADKDCAAIVKECKNSNLRYLVADLITEAQATTYRPGNEAANTAYIAELIANFENGVESRREKQEAKFNAAADLLRKLTGMAIPKIDPLKAVGTWR
jgi:hypothetical protein